MLGWIVWVGLATAAPSLELEIARGRAALDQESWEVARGHARTAVALDDTALDAYRLYLDAMSGAGMVEYGLGDLATLASTDRRVGLIGSWANAQYGAGSFVPLEDPGPLAELQDFFMASSILDPMKSVAKLAPLRTPEAASALVRAHRMAGIPAEGAMQASALYDTYPDRPELLAPLWDGDDADKSVRKVRTKLAKRVARQAASTEDPVVLYRARELLVIAGDAKGTAVATERLAEIDGAVLSPRPRLDRLERQNLARAILAGERPALVDGRPSENADVARRVAQDQLSTAPAVAVQMLSEVRKRGDSAVTALAYAQARAAAEGAPSVAAYEEAVWAAIEPPRHDLARMDRANRAADLALALAGRGEALMVGGRTREALVELTLANQLVTGEPLSAKVVLDARRAVVDIDDVTSGYGSPPIDGALDQAAHALDAKEWEKARVHANNALLILAMGEKGSKLVKPISWTQEMGLALALRGRAELELEHPRLALISLTLSTLVQPWGLGAEVSTLRGQLHEKEGHLDAAFAAYALARGMGADVDVALTRCFQGLSTPYGAASRVLVSWLGQVTPPQAPEKEHPKIARARQRGTIIALGTSGAETGRPAVGRPALAIEARDLPRSTAGSVVVLYFWSSDKAGSLAQLDLLRRLSAVIAEEGLNVVILGVAMDGDPQRAQDVMAAKGHPDIHMSWSPDLAERWAVESTPTTWIIDKEQIIRQLYVGYIGSTTELEMTVRQLVAE